MYIQMLDMRFTQDALQAFVSNKNKCKMHKAKGKGPFLLLTLYHLCGGGWNVTENPLVSGSGKSPQKCNREVPIRVYKLELADLYNQELQLTCTCKDCLINSANSCRITSEN